MCTVKHFEKTETCDICGKQLEKCYVSGGIYRCKACRNRYLKAKKLKKGV